MSAVCIEPHIVPFGSKRLLLKLEACIEPRELVTAEEGRVDAELRPAEVRNWYC
jgi:hypothetical protein